jgi:hypothetical protein
MVIVLGGWEIGGLHLVHHRWFFRPAVGRRAHGHDCSCGTFDLGTWNRHGALAPWDSLLLAASNRYFQCRIPLEVSKTFKVTA